MPGKREGQRHFAPLPSPIRLKIQAHDPPLSAGLAGKIDGDCKNCQNMIAIFHEMNKKMFF